MPVSFEQRLKPSPDTLVNLIEHESVLLNLESESYFGLDQMGTAMWTALTTSASIQAAYEKLLDQYDVGADQLRADLNELVGKLIETKLVEVAGE